MWTVDDLTPFMRGNKGMFDIWFIRDDDDYVYKDPDLDDEPPKPEFPIIGA